MKTKMFKDMKELNLLKENTIKKLLAKGTPIVLGRTAEDVREIKYIVTLQEKVLSFFATVPQKNNHFICVPEMMCRYGEPTWQQLIYPYLLRFDFAFVGDNDLLKKNLHIKDVDEVYNYIGEKGVVFFNRL